MEFPKLNKKGMQIKSAFFSIVIGSFVIITVGIILNAWAIQYDSGITTEISGLSEYDKLNTISGEANEQKAQISPQDPGTGTSTSDYEGQTFRGSYGIITNIFKPFNIGFQMLESLEKRFGLPPYVVETILTLMFFAITMTLIGIIFRIGKPI